VTIARRLGSARLWRSTGAVLIGLGLVLPIARPGGGPADYAYLFDASFERIRACREQHAAPASLRCYLGLEPTDALWALPFLWPVAAVAVAGRERRRGTTAVRLALEPVLLLVTAGLLGLAWLSHPAVGGLVATLGVPVYYVGWALQVVPRIVGRPIASAPVQAP